MAKKTPVVKINGKEAIFEFFDENEGRVTLTFDINAEPQSWLDMLDTMKTFRVEYTPKPGFLMTYAVYKQKETLKRLTADNQVRCYTSTKWIAQKKVARQRRTKYIGVNKNVTGKKLIAVANEISQGKLLTASKEKKVDDRQIKLI